jgi:hypothetical protein
MLIGGHGQHAPASDLLLQQKLTAGEKVTAQVLGATRHGVSVAIGKDIFQLTMPSGTADARTLTLQAVGSASAKDAHVKIVAQDGRLLSEPILAKLSSPMVSKPAAVSTIVQKGELEVSLVPLSSQGKIAGPSLSARLQTTTFASNAEANLGSQTTASGDGAKTALETPRPGSKPATPPERLSPSLPNQSAPGPGAELSSNAIPSSQSRATEQTKPPAAALQQALGDKAPDVERPSIRQGEGHVVTKTEARAHLPGALLASASSLLSGIKHAIAGGNVRPQAVQQGQAAASSSPQIQNLSTEDTVLPKAPVLSSHTPEDVRKNTPFADLKPSALARSDFEAGPDRGLATTAVVVARAPTERVVLEAKGQLFRVEQPLDLPLGTTLQAIFSSSPTASAGAPQAIGSEARATLLSQLINILDEIDQAGRYETGPDDAEPRRQLPQPDRHLASRYLSLLNLGDEMAPDGDPLAVGRQNMTTEAQKDQIQGLLRDLRSVSVEPSAEGWKSMTLPLGHDQSQAVMFHIRDQPLDPDDRGTSQDAEPDQIQRAVFDFSLSELGRCQIDVLCQEKRFDFLMRGDRVLPPQDQQAISVLFRSACEIAGVTGEMNFKVGDFFEPTPTPSPPSKDLMT